MFVTFACRALQVTRKVDILTPLGALYYNTGRYEEALQVYREAATLQPDSTDIWLALVSEHTRQHRVVFHHFGGHCIDLHLNLKPSLHPKNVMIYVLKRKTPQCDCAHRFLPQLE